ncbi:MAG TPA: hypothetical protein VN240_11740 [Propylenella sp.]|nr:hypothetical protein [Propylenella sp.]
MKVATGFRLAGPILRRLAGLLAMAMLSLVAVPASAACMHGQLQAVEAVAAEDRGKTFEVLVADSDVEKLRRHGFEITECQGQMRSADAQVSARDAVCELAYSGNEAVQEQLRRILGVHPALLCRTAERVAGPWAGKKIDFSEDDLLDSAAGLAGSAGG